MKNLQMIEEKKYDLIGAPWLKKSRLVRMEKLISKNKREKVAEVDFLLEKKIKQGSVLCQIVKKN